MALSYPTDLTDEQWNLIGGLLPSAKPGGRKRTTDLRAVVNAIFYIVVAGCAWRMLPHEYPKWKTVYHYFRLWRINGTWVQLHERLASWVRVADGRAAAPSAGSLDSQSVKTATLAAIAVGFDGGKLVKGRKRHLMVDTLGLVLMVVESRRLTSVTRKGQDCCLFACSKALGASPAWFCCGSMALTAAKT
jgi:putative transposase